MAAKELVRILEQDSKHNDTIQYPFVAGYLESLLGTLETYFPEVEEYLALRVVAMKEMNARLAAKKAA